ncbi:MAG: L-2-amino-thiazoline-4-carboxylic acid hydrolase [Caldiserica bacterium]|nr:L-2-amino-thiazoline-4-carboxylic acid hydrolase [Caldisericota bacterium]
MAGNLNEILPDPISEADEQILLDLLKRKMMVMADVAVELLHAMEREFGSEAREVVREMINHQEFESRQDAGKPETDLRDFCAMVDKAAVGTHTWKKTEDMPDSVGYSFTRCMYAEIFCELEEPELGSIMCSRDEPWVKSFNPKLAFRRTKALMNGDEICDNTYYVET